MPYINRRIHNRILEKKRRLDRNRPLSASFVSRLKDELMIEYTYDSNAIEGNTLTLRETRLVIKEGLTVGGKSLHDHLEARNHPEGIRLMERMVETKQDFNEGNLLDLHGILMKGIESDAGKYRTSGVRIAGATFTPPPSGEVRGLVQELLIWLSENPDEHTPIELAAIFHHRFVAIHPFAEGNGRTARLLMNAILMRHGYPFIINISYRDRARYLRALSEADMGNPSPFVNFIAVSVERSIDIYIHALEEPVLLSLAEASALVPYSQEYLSLLSRKGVLGAFKKGRNWYITKENLDAYLDSIKNKKGNTSRARLFRN